MDRHSIKDDRWHILNRTGMYLGSTTKDIYAEYLYIDNKLIQQELNYTPALIKMINEIIDNSVDALKNSKKGKIDVTIDFKDKFIKVQDNGNGIPIKEIDDLDGSKIMIPFACWGKAKAGSNFNDDEIDSTTIGTNGVGSYCTNVLSDDFIGITSDGVNTFKCWWAQNASIIKEQIVSKSKNKGTTVMFYPDLKRLNTEIDNDVYLVIKQRLYNLSSVYDNLHFTLNNEKIIMSIDNLIPSDSVVFKTDKYVLAISKNDEDDFKCFSIINGLNISGGSHINYILKNSINTIKDKLPKKYDDITNGDIKNKLQIYFIGKDFPKIDWEGQTKEKIKNSDKDISTYLGEWKSLLDDLQKNKDLLKHITFLYDVKLEVEAKKELKNLVKVKNEDELLTERYLPATREKKYLVISEGTSAKNSQIKALGNYEFGFFEGTGVPANVLEIDLKRFKENKRGMPELYKIISTEDYEYILLGSDSDADGSHINGLWLAFMFKYFPEKLKANKVGMLKTPLIVVRNKKDEIVATLYDFEEIRIWESNNDSSKYDMDYKKGYGSLRGPDEMIEFVERDGLDKIIDIIKWSDDDEQLIYNWLGKDNVDIRKQMLLSNEFDLNKVV